MKYVRRILLLLTGLAFSEGLVFAADLHVTVREKGTGDPIAGATVVTAGGEYTRSDDQGRAILDAKLPTQLKALAPGYETLIVEINKNNSAVLYLIPHAYRMQGLSVVEDRIPEKVSKVVLSGQELRNAPGSGGDPVKVIQSLPGVVTATEGTGTMYMRGSGTRDNSVRVNGLPIDYLYHLGGIQSTINPALVGDFNVFLAGFPVEYGDHLGGVIDVRLRPPATDRLHQTYSIGTYQSSFLVEGPISGSKRDSFYVAGRRSYLDFVFSPDQLNKKNKDTKNELITVPRFYDAQALWHHRLDHGALQLQYFSAGDELSLLNKESAPSQPELAGELNSKIGYQTVGVDWHEQWNQQWSHKLPFAVSQSNQSTTLGRDANGDPFYVDANAKSAWTQPEVNWQPTADDQYTAGVELENLKYPLHVYIAEPPAPGQVDYDFTTAPKRRIDYTLYANLAAPFLKYRRKWGNLTTGIGLRYSTFRGSGGIADTAVSPRASLEYALTPFTLLMAAWGRYVQIPQGQYLLDGLGNPNLVYTKAEHRIVGVKHKLDELWSVQVDAYHKPMSDLVVGTGQSQPDNFVNKGSGEAYGIDLLIKRRPSEGKKGWLSYSYARSTRTNDLTGEHYYFPGDQPHTLTLVWSQPLGGTWNKWLWGIRAQVHSGRPYTPVVGRHQETLADGTTRIRPEYGAPYSERLPTYYRLDMRFDRRVLFNSSTLNFYIDLRNVTGHNNVTRYDYGSQYEYINNPKEINGVPFMPFFGVETTF